MTRRIHTTVRAVVAVHLTVLVLVGYQPERSSRQAIGSKAKQTHNGVIADASVPATCVQGDIVPVVFTVENRGNQKETFGVMLTDEADGKEIGRRLVMLTTNSPRAMVNLGVSLKSPSDPAPLD